MNSDSFPASPLTTAVPETTAPGTTVPAPKIHRHPLVLTFFLGCLAAMGPLAIDMYLPAFPKIAEGLHTDVASIQRTLASYFVGIALGQLIYGPISDRVGRKIPLYTGLLTFALASVGCAVAWDTHSLTFMRFLQALGGCAEMVVARAIVRDLFDNRDSARVFSQLMLVMGVAPLVAPLLGGYFAVHLGWRAIFWFLAAAAVLLLVFTALYFRESHPPEKRTRHTVGETLSTYLTLLRDPQFMAYSMTVSFASAGLFAYVGGSSYIFQHIYHIPEESFAFYFGPVAAGLIGMSQVNGYLVYRMEMHRLLRLALCASALAGCALLFTSLAQVGGFWGLYIPLWCFMATLGFVFANATVLAMSNHGRIAGNASAVIGSLQFGVSALGGVAVSALQNGTPIPMSATIAGCALTALIINLCTASAAPPKAA